MKGLGYDTTHCTGQGCILKPKCLRYLSDHNPYGQTFFPEPPYKDGKCEFYVPLTPPCVGHANEEE